MSPDYEDDEDEEQTEWDPAPEDQTPIAYDPDDWQPWSGFRRQALSEFTDRDLTPEEDAMSREEYKAHIQQRTNERAKELYEEDHLVKAQGQAAVEAKRELAQLDAEFAELERQRAEARLSGGAWGGPRLPADFQRQWGENLARRGELMDVIADAEAAAGFGGTPLTELRGQVAELTKAIEDVNEAQGGYRTPELQRRAKDERWALQLQKAVLETEIETRAQHEQRQEFLKVQEETAKRAGITPVPFKPNYQK